MSDTIERYIRLGLRLGRHVEGLVDSYVGPHELATAVAEEPLVPPEALVEEARALGAAVAGDRSLEPERCAWLGDQLQGLSTFARVLSGEQLPYPEEVEGCYGVRPERGSTALYAEAHAALDELLPGRGSLVERSESWRAAHLVPADQAAELLTKVAAVLRRPTAAIVELPENEEIVVEPVQGEPWWAFNYYLGNMRSRIVINIDMATSAAELVHLAAHEGYPGHHAERAVKEQRLVRERGFLEETIQLVPTPAAVVSEGIAETGERLVVDGPVSEELEHLFAAAGVTAELEQSAAIERARAGLAGVGLDAALLIHVERASHEEVLDYVRRWSLVSRERAEQTLAFVTDLTWRAYAITYVAGLERCAAYVDEDVARFARLLREQTRVAELVAAG